METAFAKEVTGREKADNRLLALLGNDRELDLAPLDIENRVSSVAL